MDLGEIAKRHSEDLGSKRLNDAVMLSLSPASSNIEWTTHYKLSAQVQEMAEQIDLLKDSRIFRDFWKEAAKSLSEPEEQGARCALQLEDVYHYLYSPCFVKFFNLYDNLKSGGVTLGEVDVVFQVFKDNYSALTADLQVMCTLDSEDQKDWIKKRVEQIMEYHHLDQAVSSAEVILKVQENLGLTGDFSVLHSLLRFVSYLRGMPGMGRDAQTPGSLGLWLLGADASVASPGTSRLCSTQCLNVPRAWSSPLGGFLSRGTAAGPIASRSGSRASRGISCRSSRFVGWGHRDGR